MVEHFPVTQFRVIFTTPPRNLRKSTGHGLRDAQGGIWQNVATLEGNNLHANCMDYDYSMACQRRCMAEMTRLPRRHGAIFATMVACPK